LPEPLLNGLAYDPVCQATVVRLMVQAAVAFTKVFMLRPLLSWRGDLIFSVTGVFRHLAELVFKEIVFFILIILFIYLNYFDVLMSKINF
jgi:hypothetical protein